MQTKDSGNIIRTHEEFIAFLNQHGMERSDFIKLTKSPPSTVWRWGRGGSRVPAWAIEFVLYYMDAVKYKNLKKTLAEAGIILNVDTAS